MSCDRASQIDVEAFLIASDGRDFEAFRAHFPDCEACSEQVARWTALDLALRDALSDELGSDAMHPEVERLELFARDATSLGAEAQRIDRHLESCPGCRTELSMMARFDPAELSIGRLRDREPAEALDRDREGVFLQRFRAFFESLSEALLAPGFARVAVPAFGAVLLVVAVLWSRGGPDPRSTSPQQGPELVVEQPTPALPKSVPEAATQERVELAESAPEATGMRAPDVDPPLAARPVEPSPGRATPAQPAPEEREPSSTPGSPTSQPAPEAAEEILLAALGELPTPAYRRPGGAASGDWMGESGPIRSGGELPRIEVRAPAEHIGLTLRASPRLWWSLPNATELPIEILVIGEEAIEPIVSLLRPGPHEAGLHVLDLADQNVRLEPNAEYRWFVTLQVDPDRPTRNPSGVGGLRLLPADDPRHALVESTLPTRVGHVLAEQGLWYDAYDFFATLSQAHPENAAAAAACDRLVSSVAAPR